MRAATDTALPNGGLRNRHKRGRSENASVHVGQDGHEADGESGARQGVGDPVHVAQYPACRGHQAGPHPQRQRALVNLSPETSCGCAPSFQLRCLLAVAVTCLIYPRPPSQVSVGLTCALCGFVGKKTTAQIVTLPNTST